MRYNVVVNVDQIVTKEIALIVEARSEEEAQERARDALQNFPQPVETPGILQMVANKAHYWIPKSIDFLKIKKVKTNEAN